MQFVTIRVVSVFVAIVSCAISSGVSDAQEAPPAQTPSSTPEVTATPEATAQPHPSWLSPDQKWEYRSSGDNAKIVKTGTDQVVLDFSDESYFGCDEATLSWASELTTICIKLRTRTQPPDSTLPMAR
jgi:hypothetical protein